MCCSDEDSSMAEASHVPKFAHHTIACFRENTVCVFQLYLYTIHLKTVEPPGNFRTNAVESGEHGKWRSIVICLLATSLTSKLSSLDIPT